MLWERQETLAVGLRHHLPASFWLDGDQASVCTFQSIDLVVTEMLGHIWDAILVCFLSCYNKTLAKSNVWRKDFIWLTGYSPSLTETKAGTKARTREESHLLAWSAACLILPSHYLPLVLCWGWDPYKSPPFCVSMSIGTVIVTVASLLFLGYTISWQTSWSSSSHKLLTFSSMMFWSHMHKSCVVNVPMGVGLPRISWSLHYDPLAVFCNGLCCKEKLLW